MTLEVNGESKKKDVFTPERVIEIGEKVRQWVLEMAGPDEVNEALRQRILDIAGPYDVNEALCQRILEKATPEERLAGMNSAERQALLRLLQEGDTGAGDEASGNVN